MTERAAASGPEQGRRRWAAPSVWALLAVSRTLCVCLLGSAAGALGCSDATDVVGVLQADETGELEGASESEGIPGVDGVPGAESASSEFSIVAGMPVSDWENRPALEWPFSVSLREFFSDGSWPGPFGPPPRVEREVIAVMGHQAKIEHVRVVAVGPEITEQLRDVFARAKIQPGGAMVASVMRDRRSDEYRVALGRPSCGYSSSSHHGGPCAEAAAGLERP